MSKEAGQESQDQEILEAHRRWAESAGREGERANLSRADLSGAKLSKANLSAAYLSGTDLYRADLTGANLSRADLTEADLTEANLNGAKLSKANLRVASLARANLRRADLSGAYLRWADLTEANLTEADLTHAHLSGANLRLASLARANLRRADLTEANLSRADLTEANLREVELDHALFVETVFANINLSTARGLASCIHTGPSVIDHRTLGVSGPLPSRFLSGCGLSDSDIEYAKLYADGLSNEQITSIGYRIIHLRTVQAIQINPLFISYSHDDVAFVDHLETRLTEKGIRFWQDVHHATAGPLEKQVDRAIRFNPTVLLILSNNSVQTDWVEYEVRFARKLAKEARRHVLCPVALDDSWKTCPWPERLREQIMKYNILDFQGWRDEEDFTRMFSKLIQGLDLFYRKLQQNERKVDVEGLR